jgi:hypothetical protein
LSVLTVGLGLSQLAGTAVAGDCCHEGGVTYHGRIVMKIHKTWLGASAAPAMPVFVQQAPPMMAVPYVSGVPMVPAVPMIPAAAPMAPAAPAAPVAPASAATQRELDELRNSVEEIRKQVIELAKEVKASRPS